MGYKATCRLSQRRSGTAFHERNQRFYWWLLWGRQRTERLANRTGRTINHFLYGQFLNTFYKEKEANYKYQLLENEPVYNPKYDLFFCLLAGSVEKLANDYHLPVPTWTGKSQYYLNRIYYAYDTKNTNFQKFLIQTTPDEYKKRKDFVLKMYSKPQNKPRKAVTMRLSRVSLSTRTPYVYNIIVKFLIAFQGFLSP